MTEGSPTVSPPPLPSQREKRKQSRPAAHGGASVQWTDEDGKLHSVITRIRDRSGNGLGVYADEPIQAGKTVWVVEADLPVERLASVRYCRPRYGRWKVGLAYVAEERRKVERCPVEGDAELSWGYVAAEAFRCEVQVLNVSPLGAMVKADRPVPLDCRARLRGAQMECMGYIRHCSEAPGDEEGYLVGLLFAASPTDNTKSVREMWSGLSIQYP